MKYGQTDMKDNNYGMAIKVREDLMEKLSDGVILLNKIGGLTLPAGF